MARHRAKIVGALFLVMPASALHAQGSSIHSHGGCMLGRNSTGVAEPCADGSAVFYNPAALAFQGSRASLGMSALYSTSTFTFDDSGASFDSEQGTKVAPHAWLQTPLTDWLGAGRGVLGAIPVGFKDGLTARARDRSARRNPRGRSTGRDRVVAVYDSR